MSSIQSLWLVLIRQSMTSNLKLPQTYFAPVVDMASDGTVTSQETETEEQTDETD